MSRSRKDKRGGHEKNLGKYPVTGMVPSKLKRLKRKKSRAMARNDMVNGREPLPVYSPEKEYFD